MLTYSVITQDYIYSCNYSVAIQNYDEPPTRNCQLQHSWAGELVILKLEIILRYLINLLHPGNLSGLLGFFHLFTLFCIAAPKALWVGLFFSMYAHYGVCPAAAGVQDKD